MSVGVTAGVVPANYFAGQSFGGQLITWAQFAWPLFMGRPQGFEFAPALATDYQQSTDGLTHTFTLREKMHFHDGSAIDAKAVAENLRAYFFRDHPLRDKGSYFMTYSGFGEPPVVDRVDVVDELRLRVILTNPKIAINGDPLYQFMIINPKIMARKDYGTDTGALRDAGSGPFRIARFEASTYVEFERFDGFFEPVYLDRLRYQTFADGAAMGLALRAGEVDAAIGPSPADFDSLAAQPEYRAVVASDAGANMYFTFNTPRKPELEDRRVREAIWLATNRPAYRQAFYSTGTAQPNTQPAILQGTRGYVAELNERPYDPDRARTLLAEAGATDLTIKAYTTEAVGPVAQAKDFWQAVGDDLGTVGITLDLTVTDSGTYDSVQDWDLQFGLFDGIGPGILFLLYFKGLGPGYQSPDPRADRRVREWYEAAFNTADLAKQTELLRKLIRLDHDELMMGIPVALVAQAAITRRQVHGFRLSPLSNDPQHQTWVDLS